MQMTLTLARVVLSVRDTWAMFADRLGEVVPQPLRSSRSTPAGEIVTIGMQWLRHHGALQLVQGDAYLPGPRWDEAVAAAEAMLGVREAGA